MTNEEAIELLNQEKIPMILDGKPNEHLAVAHIKAIEALEENTKLKAEIEQLKSESETYYKLYLASIDARQILTECVEHLKAELEQSVKLPCKVGDMVYLVDYEENHIDESIVIDIVYHSASGEFEFETEYLYFYSEDLEDDYIFFTREEAEQSLKGVNDESKTN